MDNGNETAQSASAETDWFDHGAATTVMEGLRHLLAVSRLDPRPWQPIPILCGEPGVGKTRLCHRFMDEARVGTMPSDRLEARPANIFAMPVSCALEEIDRRLRGAMDGRWQHEGSSRTTLFLVDGADALLHVSRARRSHALATLKDEWKRFLFVLVGSHELAQTLAPEQGCDPVTLTPIPSGPEFDRLVAALAEPEVVVDVDELHKNTGGVIGRVLALARRGRRGHAAAGASPTRGRLPH